MPATGQPATLTVRVMNTSTIVDGYGVEAPGAPAWLIVESDQIHLLPGTEEALAVRMRVNSTTLLPAQQIDLMLRVRSMSQAGVHQDVPIEVTVPIVDVPVQLHAEPRLLRMKDTDSGRCTIAVDNSRSNRPMLLRFSGSDAEQAVKFDFDPPIVDVGPGASASVVAQPHRQPTRTGSGAHPAADDHGERRPTKHRDRGHPPAGDVRRGRGPSGHPGGPAQPGARPGHHHRLGANRRGQPGWIAVGAPGAEGQRP